MIRFGLDKAAWQPQNMDALGDTLCGFEPQFSKHSTDLGRVTVDLFRSSSNKTRRLRSRTLPPLAQFSPRKFVPRLSLLLVGEATRIGLAPWLSSRNETRRLRSRALPQLASSRRESSHREPQAFCWWAKLLDLG